LQNIYVLKKKEESKIMKISKEAEVLINKFTIADRNVAFMSENGTEKDYDNAVTLFNIVNKELIKYISKLEKGE
jgi:hypothetical protein